MSFLYCRTIKSTPVSECSAYSSVVDAFRAGGPLTEEKSAALLQLGQLLGVGVERHRAEVRRSGSDELLSTVALRLGPADPEMSWQREGRRIIPILPRAAPITAVTSLAGKMGAELRLHNSALLPPDETRSAPPPPPLDPLPPPIPEPNKSPEFALPEAVPRQNGVGKRETDAENGFVVLPSGMAVRVREDSPSAGKRGKRKRSASKSIEVFPDGVPVSKPTSVLGAGHGYARPPPVSIPEAPLSPSRRPAGRPANPSSPVPGPPGLAMARGRPRLLSAGPRPRGPRPRIPRPGLLISPRPPSPSPGIFNSQGPPLILSQSSAVQLPVGPPRPTTIQLKQEPGPSTIQGLKVISHSTTKVMPKTGVSAVYMLPPVPRMAAAPHRLLAVSSAPPRLLPPSPGLPTGVIRTVRARHPGIPGKPSVIVVQKGAPGGFGCLRTTRPATVSLYRPRPLAPGSPGPRLPGPGEPGGMILVDLAQAQDPSSHALSSLLSASGMLPDTIEGGQRKIFVQRPATTPTSTVWVEASAAPTETSMLATPSTSSMGRMVTLPPRPVATVALDPPTSASPPGFEVRPGRTNGETNGES